MWCDTNIPNLSPTHLAPNIRHQDQCKPYNHIKWTIYHMIVQIKAFLYNKQNKSAKITSVLKLIIVFFMITSFKLSFVLWNVKISPSFRFIIEIIICNFCDWHFHPLPVVQIWLFQPCRFPDFSQSNLKLNPIVIITIIQ